MAARALDSEHMHERERKKQLAQIQSQKSASTTSSSVLAPRVAGSVSSATSAKPMPPRVARVAVAGGCGSGGGEDDLRVVGEGPVDMI